MGGAGPDTATMRGPAVPNDHPTTADRDGTHQIAVVTLPAGITTRLGAPAVAATLSRLDVA